MMKAQDVMSSPVISVGPETSVRRIAALLAERRISAVPVLAEGRLAGIVSEADLLHRHEIGTDAEVPQPWWLRLFGRDRSLEAYVKSHALRARDVMTRAVATVSPDAPLAEIAALLEARRVKRVPVVQDGRAIGMVSRSDLVRALAASSPRPRDTGRPASDVEIRARLLHELEQQPWWHNRTSQVTVDHATVIYSGTIDVEAERDAARVAAENVPGVRRVEDRRFLFRDLPSMA
jgi:CBS domain-containing protein